MGGCRLPNPSQVGKTTPPPAADCGVFQPSRFARTPLTARCPHHRQNSIKVTALLTEQRSYSPTSPSRVMLLSFQVVPGLRLMRDSPVYQKIGQDVPPGQKIPHLGRLSPRDKLAVRIREFSLPVLHLPAEEGNHSTFPGYPATSPRHHSNYRNLGLAATVARTSPDSLTDPPSPKFPDFHVGPTGPRAVEALDLPSKTGPPSQRLCQPVLWPADLRTASPGNLHSTG